jgi:hypothetical protein
MAGWRPLVCWSAAPSWSAMSAGAVQRKPSESSSTMSKSCRARPRIASTVQTIEFLAAPPWETCCGRLDDLCAMAVWETSTQGSARSGLLVV